MSQVSQSALRRLDAIIALVEPDKFPRLHAQFAGRGKRLELIRLLARQAGISQRTLYWRLSRFKEGGVEALAPARLDRGRPRQINQAAAEFLLNIALPVRRGLREPSITEIWDAYCAEREWRQAHAGRPLDGEFERHKYKRWLDRNGKLRPDAQMPKTCHTTVRTWLHRISDLARLFGSRDVNLKIRKSGGHNANGS